MTAVDVRSGYLPPMEKWRRGGGLLTTARVTEGGDVVLHQVKVTAMATQRGDVELWPKITTQQILGTVDPFDVDAWFHAEVLLRKAGWRPACEWTTVDRMPAVRLVRDPNTSPGTVPGGN